MKNAQVAESTLASIAKRCLQIDTLETRNSDDLDFHEVAVWTVREALKAAYEAGLAAAAADSKKAGR